MHIVNIDKFKGWHGVALNQIAEFEKVVADLAARRRVTAKVIGSHRSKSIDLPVVLLALRQRIAALGDA